MRLIALDSESQFPVSTSDFSLRDGMDLAGIGLDDLWVRYLSLGGNNDRGQLGSHITAQTCPDPHDHNVIAQAINEPFLERGQDHPVAYKHLTGTPDLSDLPDARP